MEQKQYNKKERRNMITEKLEKQYIDFVNNMDMPEGKKCMIQYSYINKIIEYAIKENNMEKAEEYKQKRQIAEDNLSKFGIKIN